jgi:hypothetical protein
LKRLVLAAGELGEQRALVVSKRLAHRCNQ